MLLSLTLPLGLIIKRAFHRPEHKTYSLSNVLSCVSAFSSSTSPGVLQEECAHRPSYYPLRQPEQEGAQGVRTDLPVPSARPECAMAAATRARGRSGETHENPPGPARSPRGPGAQLAPRTHWGSQKKKINTRPHTPIFLEDRLGLDDSALCFLADLFPCGRTILG